MYSFFSKGIMSFIGKNFPDKVNEVRSIQKSSASKHANVSMAKYKENTNNML